MERSPGCRVDTEWSEINSGLTYTDRVQGTCGLTLLQYYATKHASSASIAQWRSCIVDGTITINGEVVQDPEAPIPPGATLQYHRPGWAEPPAPAFLDVLWYDAHVVAVHKPSGIQVLPAGPFHERCALTLLRRFHEQHAAELAGMPAPVHRLGRGTSGVLICCCSEEARSRLSRDFVEHGGANTGRMRKVYRTLVTGLIPQDEGKVDVPIGKMEYPGVRGGLFAACPPGTGKPSRSRYTVLHRDEAAGTTLVDVEIFTGRPHQIRIHMAAAGHPLVGDPLYAPGGQPWPRQAEGTAAAGECMAAGADADAEQQQQQQTAAAADGGGSGSAECQRPCGGGTGGSGAQGCSATVAQQVDRVVMPGDCGYLLHSMVLEFNHPVTQERIVATCEPPPPLQLPLERQGGGSDGPS